MSDGGGSAVVIARGRGREQPHGVDAACRPVRFAALSGVLPRPFRRAERSMSVLKSAIDPRSQTFRDNAAAMRALVDDLRATVQRVKEGGGERARQRHVARGKLLPRDRVRTLLDPGAPFLELSQLAAHGVYEDDVPARPAS